MTAYIKMIEVWMIFTIMYPFCVVMLYAVLELVSEGDSNIPVSLVQNKGRMVMNKKTKWIVTYLLNPGLPLIAIFFIMIFSWLGINNTRTIKTNNSC